MDRKMIYFFSLVGFFLMWGVFGFVAAAPRSELPRQLTAPSMEMTAVTSEAVDQAGIPVTGTQEPVWSEIVGFYGMIGLAALFLILGLLSFANKSTASYVARKDRSSEETRKN